MYHAWYMQGTCRVHAQVYHSMHESTIPGMVHAYGSPFHAWYMHMVLPSMNGTCMHVTPDTVNNNFGSKKF